MFKVSLLHVQSLIKAGVGVGANVGQWINEQLDSEQLVVAPTNAPELG